MESFPAKHIKTAESIGYIVYPPCQEGFSEARRPFMTHLQRKHDCGVCLDAHISNASEHSIAFSASEHLQESYFRKIFDGQNVKLTEISCSFCDGSIRMFKLWIFVSNENEFPSSLFGDVK